MDQATTETVTGDGDQATTETEADLIIGIDQNNQDSTEVGIMEKEE
jgi:hypothetical protein